MDAIPTVTIYLDYDVRVSATGVFRATSQASKMFAKIGMPVQFRYGRKPQTAGQNGLELNIYVGIRAPREIHSRALGSSHPFSQDGRIEVFYSQIQNYNPEVGPEYVACLHPGPRDRALVLEGIDRHSATGVMKAEWNFQDLLKIRGGALEFETSDVEFIRVGIENRVRGRHCAGKYRKQDGPLRKTIIGGIGVRIMEAERLRRIEQLFHAARDLEPERTCGTPARFLCVDEDLLQQVEALLAMDQERAGVLDQG